jgi:uncharacterized protein
MWHKMGVWLLRFRLPLLIALFSFTGLMAYYASKVKISYEFVRAIPTDNPKYQAFLAFQKQFGEDGNMMTVGFQTDKLFTPSVFNELIALQRDLKSTPGVDDVLSPSNAVTLKKNDSTEKLQVVPIFPSHIGSAAEMDSCRDVFLSLPFYRGLMYNAETHAYLVGVRINKDLMNTKGREKVVADISEKANAFGKRLGLEMHLSGLPLIRTDLAVRVEKEMRWILVASLLLSALILLLFFRSVSTMVLSLTVVAIGVIWSLGTMHLCGFQITLLNALIPSLVVVIGIPNCIYFLNKYHTSYITKQNKKEALVNMVSKMGIVTLFCNITAAIGFAVFALTRSAVLKEFGIVAGINIMALFVISFILLPTVLSYLPAPKTRHVKYLENKWLIALLTRIEIWVFSHKRVIYIVSIVVVIFSVVGMMQLRTEGFIVDDLPKKDKVFLDLKFFEQHFKGIMPVEIVVDTRKKYGFSGLRSLELFAKIDSFSQYVAAQPDMARPLSLAEGLKFAKQGFYDGDSANYSIPNAFDGAFVGDYLRAKKDGASAAGNAQGSNFQKLLTAFIDSNKQKARISVNMADVGSKRLPGIIDMLTKKAGEYFDSSKFTVQVTGTSVTFLEGSRFIITGLKESIMWAFLLIAVCMLYLFRSFRILLCSLIPNLIPLLFTAGVMGWMGIAIKPSTVLIFSVALGIAIDVTIRFLVNYKQELPAHGNSVRPTVIETIRHTGISILYTSMVLVAGFVIFVFSGFGGTQALGLLTSLTLLSATLTNLVLLPVLLIDTAKKGKEKGPEGSDPR